MFLSRVTAMSCTLSDWDKAAGLICPRCGREVWQAKGGICVPCWDSVNEIELRLPPGISTDVDPQLLQEITRVMPE